MRGIQSVTADKERILITKMDPIILFVSRFSDCLSFYRKALGLSLKKQVAGWAEFDVGGATFALHSMEDHEPKSSTKTHEGPLALHFVTRDMKRVQEAIEAWGGSMVEGPEEKDYSTSKVLEATFRDPDGNEMEIVEYL
ncbi:MAG: VOC family protein [Thermoplasmata archaeon]